MCVPLLVGLAGADWVEEPQSRILCDRAFIVACGHRHRKIAFSTTQQCNATHNTASNDSMFKTRMGNHSNSLSRENELARR